MFAKKFASILDQYHIHMCYSRILKILKNANFMGKFEFILLGLSYQSKAFRKIYVSFYVFRHTVCCFSLLVDIRLVSQFRSTLNSPFFGDGQVEHTLKRAKKIQAMLTRVRLFVVILIA